MRSTDCNATHCTPPEDRSVQCPSCHQQRHVAFAEIQNLERWEETFAGGESAA
jgi:hypothetical protein